MSKNKSKPKKQGPAKNPGKKSDWMANNIRILDYYMKFYEKEDRFPTQRETAKGTGFALDTISRHMKTFDWVKVQDHLKPLVTKVLEKMANRLLTDDEAPAIGYKYFIQMVADWAAKSEVKVTGQIDFRITKEEIKNEKDPAKRLERFHNYTVSGGMSGNN